LLMIVAIRRGAQGASLVELAHSYNVSRATISRLEATCWHLVAGHLKGANLSGGVFIGGS